MKSISREGDYYILREDTTELFKSKSGSEVIDYATKFKEHILIHNTIELS